MKGVFFEEFLKISEINTVIFLLILVALFFLMSFLARKKVTFAKRVLLATALGLVLGIVIQLVANYPKNPEDIVFINEVTTWYGLFGYGFMDLIKMLVVPLVMISIMHVIINMKENVQIGRLVQRTIIVTMGMVAISVVVGLLLGIIFNLGAGLSVSAPDAEIKEVASIVDTFRGLLPANPAQAIVDVNIIAVVIFSVFIATAARRMNKKYPEIIKPFYDLINALHKIIISIAMTIIKLMPYAVIPLLANTIALRGITSVVEMGKFIGVLYLAIAVMFTIQVVALMILKINPIHYLKKSINVFVLAFTSRSSVGTLPLTIETLNKNLGVNDGTASFVASFGTTAGMQGCAGVFPALLIIFVSNMNGLPIDATLIIMTIIVVSIGSLGIAGIPGTATMAASVGLSGVGLAAYFPTISPILAIDPLIDMGRTFLNVTGSMTNALMVDKMLGTLDEEVYASNITIEKAVEQENQI